MKKITALFCVLVLLLTCGCGKTASATPESTTEATKSVPEAEPYDVSAEYLSLAMAIALADDAGAEQLRVPYTMWSVIGWYCTICAESGGNRFISEAQAHAVQNVLCPGEPYIPLPDVIAECGIADVSESVAEGETIYRFPTYADSFGNLFGQVYSYDCMRNDNMVTIVLHDHQSNLDKSAAYLYLMAPDENYVLELQSILSDGEEQETATAGNFTVEDLVQANRLSNLLSIYKSVRTVHTYMGTTMTSDYFKRDGEIVSTQKCADDTYTEYYWSYGKISAAKAGDHFVCYCSPEYLSDEENTELLNEYDLCAVYGSDIGEITEKDDTYLFSISSMDSEPKEYVVDKGTLALRSVTEHHENGEASVTTYTYNVEPETYGLLDGYDRPLRKVTMTYSDGGNEKVYTFGLPDDLEFVPTFEDEVAMYMDAAYTKPYAYPGNGADYAFYITTAMG